MKRGALLIAVAVLLAGCVGGHGGTATTTTPAPDETPAAGETADAETETDADETDGRTGVNFYVSDERNAMGDFEHLNVTVSKVGFKPAGEGDAGWTDYEVDDRTVDLTRLTGANATRIGTFPVENGTYETVFVYVSEVNGTLKDGESVRVKLPSEKLQIHQTFDVGPNETVDYVFDISVFEAGKSGKYILKPVIAESGTDAPIESVDDEEGADERGDEEEADEHDDEERTVEGDGDDRSENDADEDAELNATFVGDVTRGGNATVAVTRDGAPVANATVEVDGDRVGETDAEGRLTFSVPDGKEFEVEVETDDASAELKRHFEADDGDAETTTAA